MTLGKLANNSFALSPSGALLLGARMEGLQVNTRTERGQLCKVPDQAERRRKQTKLTIKKIRNNCKTVDLPKNKPCRTHNEHKICIRDPYSCLERGTLPSGTNPLPNTQPQRLPHAWPRSSPSRGRILPPRRLSKSGAIPRRLLY